MLTFLLSGFVSIFYILVWHMHVWHFSLRFSHGAGFEVWLNFLPKVLGVTLNESMPYTVVTPKSLQMAGWEVYTEYLHKIILEQSWLCFTAMCYLFVWELIFRFLNFLLKYMKNHDWICGVSAWLWRRGTGGIECFYSCCLCRSWGCRPTNEEALLGFF